MPISPNSPAASASNGAIASHANYIQITLNYFINNQNFLRHFVCKYTAIGKLATQFPIASSYLYACFLFRYADTEPRLYTKIEKNVENKMARQALQRIRIDILIGNALFSNIVINANWLNCTVKRAKMDGHGTGWVEYPMQQNIRNQLLQFSAIYVVSRIRRTFSKI